MICMMICKIVNKLIPSMSMDNTDCNDIAFVRYMIDVSVLPKSCSVFVMNISGIHTIRIIIINCCTFT